MGIAQKHTKRMRLDINVFTDDIDREYHKRIIAIKSKQDLIDILEDYEEFLPKGLQSFRRCDDLSFHKLKKQINRFYQRVKRGQKLPAEPTEAIMFITPPMLTIVRQISLTRSAETKFPVTWGDAYLGMKAAGLIDKLDIQQEGMYEKVIEIKEQVGEMVDTTSVEAPDLDGGITH